MPKSTWAAFVVAIAALAINVDVLRLAYAILTADNENEIAREILQNTISDRARRIAQHGSEAHSC